MQSPSGFRDHGQERGQRLNLQELSINESFQNGHPLRDGKQNSPSSLGSSDGSNNGKSSARDKKIYISAQSDFEIQWQDLFVGEEVGQGGSSFSFPWYKITSRTYSDALGISLSVMIYFMPKLILKIQLFIFLFLSFCSP